MTFSIFGARKDMYQNRKRKMTHFRRQRTAENERIFKRANFLLPKPPKISQSHLFLAVLVSPTNFAVIKLDLFLAAANKNNLFSGCEAAENKKPEMKSLKIRNSLFLVAFPSQ
jgi:hypothetical protein